MRKIKFRAWDEVRNQWLRITGFETAETSISDGYTLDGIFHDGDYVGRKGVIVTQSTGLKDKNGTEIFEGDVIKYEYLEDSCWGKAGVYTGHIRFDKGVFEIVHHGNRIINYPDGSWYEPSKCGDIKSFMSWVHNVEVIGNIYEDPELLEGVE